MGAVVETLQGWGRFQSSRSLEHRPDSVEDIQRLVQGAESGSLITWGLGRSYGDAAQASDAAVLDLGAFKAIQVDPQAGTVTAGGGKPR
jgi:hypothetical protein